MRAITNESFVGLETEKHGFEMKMKILLKTFRYT